MSRTRTFHVIDRSLLALLGVAVLLVSLIGTAPAANATERGSNLNAGQVCNLPRNNGPTIGQASLRDTGYQDGAGLKVVAGDVTLAPRRAGQYQVDVVVLTLNADGNVIGCTQPNNPTEITVTHHQARAARHGHPVTASGYIAVDANNTPPLQVVVSRMRHGVAVRQWVSPPLLSDC